MARNASVHAAGVVISPQPLRELVPLYRTNKEEIVTQYDMSGLEKLGLLKMDFLGLTTLTIVFDALALIKKHRGVEIDLNEMPLDDPKAFEIFSKGYTSGVFQFESSGMRDILRRSQPSRIEDLCALNALYRPGPIQGGMVDDFIARKHGKKEVSFDLPELKPLLEETYGVIVYQEQVMQISNVLAGYSLGDADLLRRAMGKKNAEEMAKQRVRFVTGAREKGHPQKKIEKIFDLMEQFAGYGFNKSHSAAYAYLAYVTGYLKAHYPIEFMAALLTSETGNTAKIVKYINECREMNIRVLPPDVNSSDWTFTPDGEAIRFGLGPIKNLGQGAVEAIQAARSRVGRFRSIYQFCEEVDLNSINRRMIESLVRAGAMDSLDGTRSQFMAVIDAAMEHGQRKRKDAISGQGGLFATMSQEEEKTSEVLPNVPDWTAMDKLKGEKEMLGFYVTGHPLDDYMDKVSELASHDSETLESAGLARSAEVAVCGILTTIVRKRNKEGKLWATMQLEDKKGHIETMLFASQYEKNLQFLVEDKAVLVRATVLPEENAPPRLSAQDITPLEIVRVPFATLVSIRVSLNRQTGDAAGELTDLFKRKPGNTAVRLKLDRPRDFSVLLDVPERIRPDKEFKAEVERICGPEAYEELAR